MSEVDTLRNQMNLFTYSCLSILTEYTLTKMHLSFVV